MSEDAKDGLLIEWWELLATPAEHGTFEQRYREQVRRMRAAVIREIHEQVGGGDLATLAERLGAVEGRVQAEADHVETTVAVWRELETLIRDTVEGGLKRGSAIRQNVADHEQALGELDARLARLERGRGPADDTEPPEARWADLELKINDRDLTADERLAALMEWWKEYEPKWRAAALVGGSVAELRNEGQELRVRLRTIERWIEGDPDADSESEAAQTPAERRTGEKLLGVLGRGQAHPEYQLSRDGRGALTALRHAAWMKGAKRSVHDLEVEWRRACAYVVGLEAATDSKAPPRDSSGADAAPTLPAENDQYSLTNQLRMAEGLSYEEMANILPAMRALLREAADRLERQTTDWRATEQALTDAGVVLSAAASLPVGVRVLADQRNNARAENDRLTARLARVDANREHWASMMGAVNAALRAIPDVTLPPETSAAEGVRAVGVMLGEVRAMLEEALGQRDRALRACANYETALRSVPAPVLAKPYGYAVEAAENDPALVYADAIPSPWFYADVSVAREVAAADPGRVLVAFYRERPAPVALDPHTIPPAVLADMERSFVALGMERTKDPVFRWRHPESLAVSFGPAAAARILLQAYVRERASAPAPVAVPVEGGREELAAWLEMLCSGPADDRPDASPYYRERNVRIRRAAALLRALPGGQTEELRLWKAGLNGSRRTRPTSPCASAKTPGCPSGP